MKSGTLASPKSLTQFAMFAEPHLGFAKRAVLIAHETKNRQQLRLRELVLAEAAAAARKHRLGNLQGDASKRQETNFGHHPSCLDRKQQFRTVEYANFSLP
ncbi:MAG TPA: hypothetical protein VGR72_07195 [Candidatus Acidoferrales bacterium]|nr:hypothetical protein [Candidatus Acidoferrales bacterium]